MHLVCNAITMVPGERKMTRSANEDTPGACDAKDFQIDTSNDLNFPTGCRQRKAVVTQIAKLALTGHTVLEGQSGDYLVTKDGMSRYCQDFCALQEFALKLGGQS